jgi:V/A-type H+-transporting ATPase subunit I
LIRNNPVVRIIQPLFSFLGTVPGYREYDIGGSYLLFFSLFFAMILADAAYGFMLLVFSAALGIALKKKNGKFPDVAKLFMHLAVCTVVWGCINGSWFAIPPENLPHALRMLIIQPFNKSGPLTEFPLFLQRIFKLPEALPAGRHKTQWYIQFLCFTIAVIQLVWARSKNIRRKLPSLTALAEAGWLLMMLGLYFVVLFMLLKMALPPFAPWFIGSGFVIILVFSRQTGGNFFKNAGKGMAGFFTLFLSTVGGLADIISYIRLFAVGMAGTMVAQVFNTMAIPPGGLGDFGLDFIIRLAAAVLIIIFGHALNLMMTALSVVVHGVRLNLLEYAGNHLGMEWTGYKYNPFALREKSKDT